MRIKRNILFKKSFCCFLFFCLFIDFQFNQYLLIKSDNDKPSKYSNITIKDNLNFNIINQKLYYSSKFNFSKICYHIQVFDLNHNLILPSDLALYHNLHIFCFLNINNSVNIYSLASVENDKYFKCAEFSNYKEDIKIGFIIYETLKNNIIQKNYFAYIIDNISVNHILEDNDIFDFSENQYSQSQLTDENSHIETKKLKKLYFSKPNFSLKRYLARKENQWYFGNLFNDYFCFCKGSKCIKKMISNHCKYFFYLYLIDINRNVYKKNDFLFIDFILKRYSSDDAYPIFEEMINRKLNAHYLTEKKEIYEKYCHNNQYCDSIIYVKDMSYKINDDFLEKHLSLILRLKHVVTSVGININFINNLFYNIDYITYICIGHGVSYFKYYLYKSYYGPRNFDKLLIPNSEKLISMTIKYGWKDENLIKLNLPRWEKYNNANRSSNEIDNIKSNSIFIMFTWRELKIGRKISQYYIQNILNLINNEKVIKNLLKHNLTLYFTLHHKVLKYKKYFTIKDNIKFIKENDIAKCLSKTNLLVTDFSSIIFDMIYRRKPYIIYIPDANDSKIKKNYRNRCYKIINNFKNNDFDFENIYLDINSAIDKMNYYISNKFQLDTKLKKFYDEFNFKTSNSINNFINYILKL